MVLKLMCPKCGRQVKKEDFLGKVCKVCFEEQNPEPMTLKISSIPLCTNCGKIYGHKWLPRKQIWDVIKSNIQFSQDNLYLISYTLKDIIMSGRQGVQANIRYYYKHGGKKIVKTFSKSLFLKTTTCPICGKIKGNYHEAIIQIRYEGKEEPKGVWKLIEQTIRPYEEDNTIAIQDKGYLKTGGYDLNITLKTIANTIVKNLRNAFQPEYKISHRLVGFDMPASKKKYKTTYLLRFPPSNESL
ncbi:MAG: hypothetical protein COT55_00220 [Candidatus Diapherotrites archaeon CG09_land_8_20_14_0_10_32_12]|nr:MAG: hypothetical protein COT55_00220 [Candidatus Diapherotrites archaeon CG09_land_8_20_14_0_10_32_12]